MKVRKEGGWEGEKKKFPATGSSVKGPIMDKIWPVQISER